MKKKTNRFVPMLLWSLMMILPWSAANAVVTTGFNQTTAGPWVYNETANWVDGVINDTWDPSLVLTATQTAKFNANTTLTNGLLIGYDTTGTAYSLTLYADPGPYTVTLGGDITVNPVKNCGFTLGYSASKFLTLDLDGVARKFSVAAGKSLALYRACPILRM